jgi:hypothetical protein
MSANTPGPLGRVRELLASAEDDGITPGDAEALTAKATSLLAQYGLDQVRLAEVDPESGPLTDLVVDLDNPWANVQVYLLAHLAEALRCEAIEVTRPDPGTRLHLFGHVSDIERAEVLYTGMITQMSRALAAEEVPATVDSLRAWRRSWMLGWATAAVSRVKAGEVRAADEAEDVLELAIVLRERAAHVRRRADEAYPCTNEKRQRYTTVSGYNTGYTDNHENSSSNSF